MFPLCSVKHKLHVDDSEIKPQPS